MQRQKPHASPLHSLPTPNPAPPQQRGTLTPPHSPHTSQQCLEPPGVASPAAEVCQGIPARVSVLAALPCSRQSLRDPPHPPLRRVGAVQPRGQPRAVPPAAELQPEEPGLGFPAAPDSGCPCPGAPQLWAAGGLPQPLWAGQCCHQHPHHSLLHPVGCSHPGHALLLPQRQNLRGSSEVSDSGGSLTIHTFGAYFGLMVSRVLYLPHKNKRKREEQQDKGHQMDVLAVVGTIYLWIFWPSFTSTTTAHHNAENWAVLNTYFSLVASTMSTFILSPVLYEEGTPRMVQIQDATLAGLAVMGMAGEMLLTPFGALIAGFLVGLISSLGFRFFTPVLHSRLKIQDTCGVHNIHGLPGVLGALLGTLLTLLATADTFGYRLELVFPLVAQGSRTVTDQAFIQLSALPLTLLLATLGGCITGAVLKIKVLRCCPAAQCRENPGLREVAEEGSDPSAGDKELGISTLV
uniref:Rh family B glycoprotein n=1 Tax=Serinus canaria TaxID=9135 RepID=A0A8C9NKS4_SERCA